jgi:hypothetical protein
MVMTYFASFHRSENDAFISGGGEPRTRTVRCRALRESVIGSYDPITSTEWNSVQ